MTTEATTKAKWKTFIRGELHRAERIANIREEQDKVAAIPVPEVELGGGTVSIELALTDEGRRLLRTEWSAESVRLMEDQATQQLIARIDAFPLMVRGEPGFCTFEKLEAAEDEEFEDLVQAHLEWAVWSMEHQPGLWGSGEPDPSEQHPWEREP